MRGGLLLGPGDDGCVIPPVGQGLNRPAIISMQGIFPRRRSAGGGGGADLSKFAARVRRRTESIEGASYINYDPEGVWTFRVSHF